MSDALVTVVNILDTYFTVITAEMVQIDKDIDYVRSFMKRYGSRYWESSLQKLTRIKRQKENILRDVKLQIELFNIHVESGRELCNRLERVHPLIVRPKQEEIILQDIPKNKSNGLLTDRSSGSESAPTTIGKKKQPPPEPRHFLPDGSVSIGDRREVIIASSILAHADAIEVSDDEEPKKRINISMADVTASAMKSPNPTPTNAASTKGKKPPTPKSTKSTTSSRPNTPKDFNASLMSNASKTKKVIKKVPSVSSPTSFSFSDSSEEEN